MSKMLRANMERLWKNKISRLGFLVLTVFGAGERIGASMDTIETHYLEEAFWIQERTEALKNLVEELFRYSIVTSSTDLKPERLNMINVLEESLLSFYGMIQETGIRPQIHLPEIPVWRKLDISALNRIFSNIINNALKYTDGDFLVTMEKDGSILFSNKAETLNPAGIGLGEC